MKLNCRAQENCGDPSGTVKRPKHEKKDVLVLMASANGPENVSAQNKGKKKRKKKQNSIGSRKTSKGLWSSLVHCRKELQRSNDCDLTNSSENTNY